LSVTLLPRFQQFIRERQYVLNVSVATLIRYRCALSWLDTETATANDLKSAIVRMRDHGLRVVSVNSHLACIASYLHWASPTGQEKCGVGCQHLRVPKLNAEEREPEMFSEAQVKALLQWKPKTPGEYRLSTMVAFRIRYGSPV
jgi:integrase/recombinase XerD